MVFMIVTSVVRDAEGPIMQFLWSDMELRMVLTIGWLRTPGDLTGETMDTLRSREEWVSVPLDTTLWSSLSVKQQKV